LRIRDQIETESEGLFSPKGTKWGINISGSKEEEAEGFDFLIMSDESIALRPIT